MRSAVAVGCIATASAWSLVAFAQGAAPAPVQTPAAPAPAAPAPAPAAPAPTPAPSAPAPASPPAASPPPAAEAAPGSSAPAAPPPDQSGAGPGTAQQQQPAPAQPPSNQPTPAQPSTPAKADQLPTGTAAVAAKSERAPVEAKPKSDPWQDGHALALELSARISGRLNGASVSANYEERAGPAIDGAVWFTLSPQYVIGLGVKRADLGSISASSGVNTVDAGYATTAIEAAMRAFPFRSKNWDVFVGLRTGLAFQDVEATGLEQLGSMPDSAQEFQCSGVSGPGFALGAEVGAGFRLSRHLWLIGTVDANGYTLSSEMVDDCVVGIGSVATVSGGLGLLFAFDLGRDAKLSGDSPKLQSPP